jgi:hypothetical protein
LNGLTAQVQNFATGTSGTDFGISSASTTHTFNLPTASASNRGALSSADWTTFNNKASTAALANYLPLAGGTLTGALIGTTATFGSTNGIVTANRSSTSFASLFKMSTAGVDNWSIGIPTLSSADWVLFNHATGISNLSFASATGAATFSSALNGTTAAFSGNTTIGGSDGVATRLYVRTEDTANTPCLTLFKNIIGSSTEDVFRVQSFTGGVVTTASIKANGSATFLGNVSIGTTTLNLGGYTGPVLTIEGTDGGLGIDLYRKSDTTLNNQNIGFICWSASSSDPARVAEICARTSGTSENAADLVFITKPSDSIFPQERLRILSTGKVGIGTDNPPSKFSVQFDKSTAFAGAAIYDEQVFNALDHGGTLGFGGTFNSSGGYTEWSAIGGMKSNTTDGNVSGDINFYTRLNGSAMTERMRITSGGDVGIGFTPSPWDTTVFRGLQIGTSNPAFLIGRTDAVSQMQIGVNAYYDGTWKHVATNAASRYYQGGGEHVWENAVSGSANSTVAWVERMKIISGGLVGINCTPSTQLEVVLPSGSNGQIIRIARSAGSYAWGIGVDGAVSNFNFYNNGGTSVANINNSTGAYTATSDERLKENISDSDNAIEKVLQIKVRKYEWKDTDIKEDFGFVAQELYEVLPQYVSEGYEDINWGVAKAELVPLLVKAIQELKLEIDSLKNQMQ